MNNYANTIKWLNYLLYVGIAALANSLLGIFGLDGLSRWIGLAVSAATVYLLFMLAGSNPRYKTASIFYGVALVSGFFSNTFLGLVGSLCSIAAQYQEYHAHGELAETRDSKLADKWYSLFWLQLALGVSVTLLSSVMAAAVIMAANLGEAAITPVITVIVLVLTLVLKLLYLRYLKRTIQLLEEA